ncbi:hypothetical protein PV08_07688 [Exophiala spinifera]|uniref:ARID domain-containing protein n=1 Tax=Exophiala spinifera TaxID=91928 RepID=A0A0D2B7M8_9EURO|nr:uncharacterized protein PV08_07688 [Exophiala spinifera]KIW14903.1 hypothetical protein PV08_07688 [Exophiala spinifera]
MAPPPHTIIEDEEEFLNDVAAFHERRGTNFDRDGKVSGRPISLHKLYKLVMERGGYDVLSAERMQWRTLCKEFGIGKTHEAVMTFQLKTVYYKNLAAYEISTYWGEEPPPKEILEDLSAKGGNLRVRTLDNYPHAPSHAVEAMQVDGVTDSADGDDDQLTPKREKTEPEDAGSASRYPRNLRQDPKRTQIYQPDVQSTRARPVRATDSPSAPPVQPPTYQNTASDPYNPSFDWYKNYQPNLGRPLTLQQVKTPRDDPLWYPNKAKLKAQRELERDPRKLREAQKDVELLPGADPILARKIVYPPGIFNGPNIYQRCLYGLRSKVPSEEVFALHHLVKVSDERGDKYKFEGFPYLAEALLDKALEISELVYGVTWEIVYNEDDSAHPINTLNAAFGTKDLLDRIQQTSTSITDEDVEDAESTQNLSRLNEAILVIRNMVTLPDNAFFLSKMPLFKDLLVIAINLPDQPRLVEFKQSAFEILELVTRYWALDAQDPIYVSLIPYLLSGDRAVLIAVIRAITRIGIEIAEVQRIQDIPISTAERLFSFTLIDDDELAEAVFDFLYSYTAIPENNIELLTKTPLLLPSMMPRLIHLLLHKAVVEEESIVAGRPAKQSPLVCTIPTVPGELYAELLQFREPERSSRWLRCCFEESPLDEITQIAIWQAYQQRFLPNGPIAAADFIKNVSITFTHAQAQVIQTQPQARFIIKGIRPRRVLVGLHGQPYYKCLWHTGPPEKDQNGRMTLKHMCSTWYSSRQRLLAHITSDHLAVQRTTEGHFIARTPAQLVCRWNLCKHRAAFKTLRELAQHVSVHIPESAEQMAKVIHEIAFDTKDPEPTSVKHAIHYTGFDRADMHPHGISYMSVMILRNLARFASKHGHKFEKDGQTLTEQLFSAHKYALFTNLSLNKPLAAYIADLMELLDKGEKSEKRGTKREHDEDDEQDS